MSTAALSPDEALTLSIEAGGVFSPSAPIDERAMFAGRQEQLRQVIDAINQKGQHAIIFGDRGVGKTSLARVLSAFIPGSSKLFSAPVNCDRGDSFDSLWKKVFSEIQLHQLTKVGGFSAESQRPRLDAIDEPVSPDIVRRQLTLWSTEKLPVLIIDEFDQFDDRYKGVFADTIKMLSDHAVPATVILVGVADSVDELLTEHLSIERALVQVKMPRMSKSEIVEVIRNGLSRLRMTIDEESLERIAVLTQGLPHYAHLLGLHACRAALDGKRSTHIDSAILDTAIQSAIEGAQQSVRNAWHKAVLSARKDNLFADVLLSCALARTDDLGSFAAQDVRVPMQAITGKPYDIPTFAQHLNDFSDEIRGNILKKLGASRRFRYRFTNPLMQPFVVMRGFADGKINNAVLQKIAEARGQDLF